MSHAEPTSPATPHLPAASPLLQSTHVGPLLLRNRVVLAPMTRSRAVEGRVPSPLAPRYYAQRATAGLVITEATHAHPRGYGYTSTPGIHTPEQIAAWRLVTDAVHARGGRIFLQLWHTGRVGHPALFPDGATPVAPSAIAAEGAVYTPEGPLAYVTPRALDLAELPGIVESFADGARNAIAAGFDGVEVHGAHGYLLDQFLRDGSNRRTDAYGGPVENRARLLLEVTDAVAAAIGAERTGVRLSPRSPANSMHDSDPRATFTWVARALAERGLAYLHVNEGPRPAESNGDPLADPLAAELRAAYPGTLIVCGGYDARTADAVLRAGQADLVAFGTPYIANPDLVERFAEGAPLAEGDRSSFYGGDARGYVDYPNRHGVVETLDDLIGDDAAVAA